jgi:hypothetical protein
LRLGRYSNWPLRDIREMTPVEFDDYAQAAAKVVRAEHGS